MTKKFLLPISLLFSSSILLGQNLQERTLIYGEDVNLQKTLSIESGDSRSLSQYLDDELRGTGIDYRITENHVLLFRRNQTKNASAKYSVCGYISDAISRESLIGANIYCPRLGTGTVANVYGFYSLPLPEGEHTLIISYVGYESQVVKISLSKDQTNNISLRPVNELKEVFVESDRPETGAASTRLGSNTLTLQQIQSTPSMLGESDVIKSLHTLPGVQTGFAGTSQMSVRGGNLDQNLYLLDGVLLYNVHHILGFVSAFMPDAVKHVDFYRSSFPARYGGRLSSVVDVRTKDGDQEHYHGIFSIGALSSHIALEGPIVKDRTSFIVSARRSYMDWLIRLAILNQEDNDIDKFSLYFYDINAKINHKFSDSDRLFISFYRGQDGIKMGVKSSDINSDYEGEYYSQGNMKNDMHWGNNYYSLRWNHLFSPSLFSNLTVGYNRYQLFSLVDVRAVNKRNGNVFDDQRYQNKFISGIDDLICMYDFDYHPIQSHHIKMGSEYTLHFFRPEAQSINMSMKDNENNMNENYKSGSKTTRGHEFSLYIEDDMTLGERWQVNAGLRAVAYAVDQTCYPNLEPRMSVAYKINDNWRAKAAYTWMHQYVHQLTTSPLNLPTDLWVSVTRDFKPMSSHQWSAGMAYSGLKGWEFSLEAYWKEMSNIMEYKDGASYIGSSKGWETKVALGEGRCRGVELLISKKTGRTTGSLAYSLSKSDRCFPDGSINNGRRYPYEYDRRHILNLLIQHQLTKRIDVNATWSLASGGYGTIAKQTSIYIVPDSNDGVAGGTQQADYYSSRNNYHMKTRHQLDLGINFHHPTKHGERIWNVSVSNAYFHKNQDIIWTEIKEKGGKNITVIKQATVIPILPSISYCYKF